MLRSDESLGSKIRRYRKAAGLTQKELAEQNDLNESTIRNYELGNRFPDFDTLYAIAMDLNVNYNTLAGVQLNSDLGAMLAFYYMEELYGLHPVKVGETYHLAFKDQPIPDNDDMTSLMVFRMDRYLRNWYNIRELLQEGKITQEEYVMWQEKAPLFAAYDWDNEKMLFDDEAIAYRNAMFDDEDEFDYEMQPRIKDSRMRFRRNRVVKTLKENMEKHNN